MYATRRAPPLRSTARHLESCRRSARPLRQVSYAWARANLQTTDPTNSFTRTAVGRARSGRHSKLRADVCTREQSRNGLRSRSCPASRRHGRAYEVKPTKYVDVNSSAHELSYEQKARPEEPSDRMCSAHSSSQCICIPVHQLCEVRVPVHTDVVEARDVYHNVFAISCRQRRGGAPVIVLHLVRFSSCVHFQ
ncbi:hypothetical protein BDW22DRAFT_998728 [Trametopsis cervina]|nr:hypothetical protein BDW22DRAFT_998728 [Trametopsis cervina]